MGIRRTYENFKAWFIRTVDFIDYYLDAVYGYFHDLILVLFAITIFAQPLGAPIFAKWFGVDPEHYILVGIYVLFAYFIVDHIVLQKWGQARARHAMRAAPGEEPDE